ncbi:MAG: sulfatase [Armatimonadetes bacterium]|nr:sulfatase [Armatimonadota bacterium]
MKRRQFLEGVFSALGAGAVLGTALVGGCTSDGGVNQTVSQPAAGPPPPAATPTARPNILLVLMDEFRYPPSGYGPAEGEIAPLKEILQFAPTISPGNNCTQYFEGLMRLRQHGVVLRNHYIASSACVPSRTAIMTGQYASLTNVTSTDGTFKTGDQLEQAGLFLDPSGIPTIGDWFRHAGYDAKFFGKWHVSNEGDGQYPWDLSPWGFDCWPESGPEPHGANPANAGVCRDPGFAQNAVNFLTGVGDCVPTAGKPWFAVASFVNPHDIGLYPIPFYLPQPNGIMQAPVPLVQPQPIPPAGTCVNNLAWSSGQNPLSEFPAECAANPSVALNPDDFPQNNFGAPPTMQEDMSTKPTCHLEFCYKFGYALKAQLLNNPALQSILPLPLAANGPATIPWTLAYGQFWVYLHYLSDLQMRKVLQALDAQGLTNNTIVVFTADHGELAGAHNFMIEKWHSMYEEAIHVPCIVSSPLVNPSADVMREVTIGTSHIDLAPTLLGLAGITATEIAAIQRRMSGQTPSEFVGTDLSPYIRGQATTQPVIMPNGRPRFGPLFVTQDEITAPLPGKGGATFQNYLQLIQQAIADGQPLYPGPVVQPNNVFAISDGIWKFARYVDPLGVQSPQWEMYYRTADPNETTNLLDFKTMQVRTTVGNLTVGQIEAQRDLMLAALNEQVAVMFKHTV